MKTHFTTTDLSLPRTIQQSLRLKTLCGQKTTFNASPMMTNNEGGVDCARCLAKLEAKAARAAARKAK